MDGEAHEKKGGSVVCNKVEKRNHNDKMMEEDEDEEEEEVNELHSLLPPGKGGMSRKAEKVRRKVQWNDKNGHKLVEILEFQPSDASDSEDDDSDPCICTIM